ncbi:F-box/kelch-repeat protein, partial [Mucuna pruriens]
MAASRDDVTASNGHIPHAPPPLTLPDHLIEEILQWLPAKNLLRLCCVCKSWKSLISDPYFAKNQLRGSRKATRLVLCFKNASHDFIIQSYPFPKVLNAVNVSGTKFIFGTFDWMVGSCDGILCFTVKNNPEFLVLWNPCIGKFNILPPWDTQQREGSYSICGFGYDSSTRTYKVVGGFSYEYDCGYQSIEAKVLTLGTHTWTRIREFPSVLPLQYEPGKFVSGTVNWLLAHTASVSWVIVSLDFRNDSCEEVLQPDYGEEAVGPLSLLVFRDCLCILSRTDMFLDVWLMKDFKNKESWTKLFRVPDMQNYGFCIYPDALCISEDEKILFGYRGYM